MTSQDIADMHRLQKINIQFSVQERSFTISFYGTPIPFLPVPNFVYFPLSVEQGSLNFHFGCDVVPCRNFENMKPAVFVYRILPLCHMTILFTDLKRLDNRLLGPVQISSHFCLQHYVTSFRNSDGFPADC